MNKLRSYIALSFLLTSINCATAMFNSSSTHVNRDATDEQVYIETSEEQEEPVSNNVSSDNSITGYATYYGEAFHGKRTASGETFNMYALTAAHRSLPFGTLVRVTNLENSKSVVVRINDRGPVDENIIIDLSYESARRIDLLSKGMVKLEILR